MKILKIGPSSVVTSFRDRKQQKLTDRIHKKITFDIVSRDDGDDYDLELVSRVGLS